MANNKQYDTGRNGKKDRKRKEQVKICRLCEAKVKYVDFKEVDMLRKFQTEKGRIIPRRITGACLTHQKMISAAIKKARVLSLVL